MSSMHALHKILADHAHPRPASVKPGDFLEVEPDVFAFQMAGNAEEVGKLEADLAELGVTSLPLKDRLFPFLDHATPAPNAGVAAGQKRWREFFRSHGIAMQDGGAGISHLIMAEQGVVGPGRLLALRDSHTPTSGALGAFAASLAGGRLSLLALGRYILEVPKVILFRIEGTLRKGVYARDIALYINGRVGQRAALGCAAEFAGSLVRSLGMDMRFTLCNMGTEMGAMASYIQPDEVTLAYVAQRGSKPFQVYETDPGFRYEAVHGFDVSDLEPQVAVPHAPTNVRPLSEVQGQRVDQAYLGSCASGRLEDIAAAAAVLKGRKVHPDVRFIVTPGSREVTKSAMRLGYMDILQEANAIVTSAGCGACPGQGGGILAPGEVAISCNTRNFEGRMGAKASIYLASPATVAASAIEGRIASPVPYLDAA
jgi:3-isopropylmalate/(R)-2-methylmalate dehydratase large subunit